MDEEQVDPSVLFGAIRDQEASAERAWNALCRVSDKVFWVWIVAVLPIIALYDLFTIKPPSHVSKAQQVIVQIVVSIVVMVSSYLTTSRIHAQYLRWKMETDQLQTLRRRQSISYRQHYERQQRELQAAKRDS